MPHLSDLIGWTIIAVIVLVTFALGVFPVLVFGLAWGIIATIVILGVGYWITPSDIGSGYLYLTAATCILVGFVVGLLIRILT